MTITSRNTGMLLEYIPESTRGTPKSSGTLQRPSDAVSNVNLTGGNNSEIVYTIGDYDGQDTTSGLHDLKLSFEYDLQRTEDSGGTHNTLAKSLASYALTRSNGLLTPLTVYLHMTDSVCYRCCGCIIDSYTLDVKPNGRLHASVSMSVPSVRVTEGDYDSLTSSTAWGNTFETFQGATITRAGGFDDGCGGFGFTISNNPGGVPNIGKANYQAYYEGTQNISGTVNVLLHSGGQSDWEECIPASGNPTEANIVFNSGTGTSSGDKSFKWTFTSAVYTNLPVAFKVEDGFVASDVTWIAESVSLAEYS